MGSKKADISRDIVMGRKDENLSLYEDVVGDGEKTTDLSQLRL